MKAVRLATIRSATLAVGVAGLAVFAAASTSPQSQDPPHEAGRTENPAPIVSGASPLRIAPSPAGHGPPIVLYTDLASGPTHGGEHDKGTYLSIFGRNFGTAGLGTAVKVYIGSAEVDSYRYLGPSMGRPDIQQITVQVGALGGAAAGTPLPVKVVVDGAASNADQTFTINPGRILFIDNVTGDDRTARPGDITRPYRHVQTPSLADGAYSVMRAGDIIVMRGTGRPWTDIGNGGYFVKFYGTDGSAPKGRSGSGPLTIMAYPTEEVFIDMAIGPGVRGGISGVDTQNYPGGRWITIADIHVESGGNSGVINQQIGGDHWRIVNNELTAKTASAGALAGGITGNGPHSYWVGNHIHDIAGGSRQVNHGIYIDGDGSYEVAYNLIESVTGGSGFQVYVNGTNGSDSANNIDLHHNMIHDVSKHAINIADGATNNIRIWNNVVYNVRYAGLRFNTVTLANCRIYNNTFYNTNTSGSHNYGLITNDWNLKSNAIDLRNNIFWPAANTAYWGGSVGLDGKVGIISNNLYRGAAEQPAGDDHPVTGDPAFVAAGTDFHLTAGSPAVDAGSAAVSDLVTTDYDAATTRPQPAGGPYDIGAYEFLR